MSEDTLWLKAFKFILIIRSATAHSRVFPTPHESSTLLPPTRAANGICCRRRVDANLSSVRRFVRVFVVPREVHVLEWELGVPTGERDKWDVKRSGMRKL